MFEMLIKHVSELAPNSTKCRCSTQLCGEARPLVCLGGRRGEMAKRCRRMWHQSIALGHRLEHRDARRKCWALKPTFAYQILLCNPRQWGPGWSQRSVLLCLCRAEVLFQSRRSQAEPRSRFSCVLRNVRVNFGFTKTLDFGELHVALRMMPAPFQRYDRVAFYWKILGQCVLLYQGWRATTWFSQLWYPRPSIDEFGRCHPYFPATSRKSHEILPWIAVSERIELTWTGEACKKLHSQKK